MEKTANFEYVFSENKLPKQFLFAFQVGNYARTDQWERFIQG